MKAAIGLFLNFKTLKGEKIYKKVVFVIVSVVIMVLLKYILFSFTKGMNKFVEIKFEYVPEITFSLPMLILMDVLVAPVLEELVYRLPLRFTPLNLKISSIALLLFAAIIIFFRCSYVNFIILMIPLIFISLVFIVFLSRRRFIERSHVIWANNFNVIFLISLLLFSLGHLNQFDLVSSKPMVLVLLFVIIGFGLLGFFFSYVRLKLGIAAAILFHSFYNSIPHLYPEEGKSTIETQIEMQDRKIDSLKQVIDNLRNSN